MRLRGMVVGSVLLAACAAPAEPPPAAPPSARASTETPSATTLPVAAQPDIDLPEPDLAIVRGATRVEFDGLQEGLVWPALDKAAPPRKAGDVVTLQVARGLPTIDVLRAAFTLRPADLRVQSLDATGTMHAIELKARRDGPSVPGCHLAVFLRPDGSLRVASPGGAVVIMGDDPAGMLERSLSGESSRCPIKYVAFGAESDAAPWGPVFDVIGSVEASKAAGESRYVLAQAMHAAPAQAPAAPSGAK